MVIRGGGIGDANQTLPIRKDLYHVHGEEVYERLWLEQNEVKKEREKVGEQIDSVEREIKDVEAEQKDLNKKADSLLHDKGANKKLIKKIMKDIKYLRTKKEHLRTEEEQLRTEKEYLLKKEEHLLKNEKYLRENVKDKVKSLPWIETILDLSQAGFSEDRKIFTIDRALLNPSPGPAGLLMLYCRESFNEQWRFLEEKVCKEGCLGWILGPPGTGKTTTTTCFLLSQSMEARWRVMFVRLWKAGPVSLIQVVDGKERRCDFTMKRAGDEIEDFLMGWGEVSEKHLLSLDGYMEENPDHNNMISICMLWRRQDWENRRLVITTSMGARTKVYSEQDMIEKIEEMKIYSWMLEEYKEAVKHDLLYKSVANMMGISLETRNTIRRQETEQERRAREVESKYQIVGGSCRYMFQCTTAEAIKQLCFAMASVDNFEMLMDLKTGDRAKLMVNLLHGMYRIGDNVHWGLVSRFVATELAQRLGETFVRKIEQLAGIAKNPILGGVLFEMLFFARIGNEQGLRVTSRTGEEASWESLAVKTFDPTQLYTSGIERSVCLKPIAWNQGGYDAVILDLRERIVRFVQVTAASKHDLRLQYFADCMDTLSMERWGQWKLEIVFVVPKDNLANFRLSEVVEEGALAKYGWRAGEETSKVRVVGMDPRPQGWSRRIGPWNEEYS